MRKIHAAVRGVPATGVKEGRGSDAGGLEAQTEVLRCARSKQVSYRDAEPVAGRGSEAQSAAGAVSTVGDPLWAGYGSISAAGPAIQPGGIGDTTGREGDPVCVEWAARTLEGIQALDGRAGRDGRGERGPGRDISAVPGIWRGAGAGTVSAHAHRVDKRGPGAVDGV